MSTEVMFVQRSEIVTTRRSSTAVITTRMVETVHRLVFVTTMAHGHHWDIRPPQLDVCSRANKHSAGLNFVQCICIGVRMPSARKRDAPGSYEAAEGPGTVASHPASN